MSCKLDYSRDFYGSQRLWISESGPSFRLVFEVKKKNLLRLNPAIGESRIIVGDLVQLCMSNKG